MLSKKEMLQTRVIMGRSAYYHVHQNFLKNYTLYKLACILEQYFSKYLCRFEHPILLVSHDGENTKFPR